MHAKWEWHQDSEETITLSVGSSDVPNTTIKLDDHDIWVHDDYSGSNDPILLKNYPINWSAIAGKPLDLKTDDLGDKVLAVAESTPLWVPTNASTSSVSSINIGLCYYYDSGAQADCYTIGFSALFNLRGSSSKRYYFRYNIKDRAWEEFTVTDSDTFKEKIRF